MKLYRKLKYFAIPVFAAFMSVVLLCNQVSAAQTSLAYNELFSVNAHVFNSPVLVYDMPLNYGEDAQYTARYANYQLSINSVIQKSIYDAPLYVNGWVMYRVQLNYTFPGGASIAGLDCSVETENTSELYSVVTSRTYTSSTLSFTVATYCDNYYVGTGNNFFAEVLTTFNVYFMLGLDFPSPKWDVGSLTVTSQGYAFSTSVQPSVTRGLAGVISQSSLFGIQQSGIDSGIDNISTLLSQIKTQDLSLYNQVISQIASGIANDNALFASLNSNLSGWLTGVYDSGAVKDVGDILVDLLNQIIGFRSANHADMLDIKALLDTIINSNRAEASSAAQQGSSAASELDSLASDLELSTGDVNGVMGGVNDYMIQYDISEGQGDLFYWLHGNTPILIILTVSCSLGLVGFILYGKG